ncbi:cuticle protein 10.9 [Trichonephila inaurata madagascariensis]|uniref:Cuticle protein 10.9 n=1 Tax=Trichonephila inaurata madagascariensis TaxID=2747483 RepID=A0A8X7CQB7_9ARAC|nr:cuticle protein 10.9 [Trichonephila inaurata madagascariensis]
MEENVCFTTFVGGRFKGGSQVLLIAALAAVAIAKPYEAPAQAESAASAHAEEEKYPPQPYEYGYETNDDKGTTTFRKETSDGKGKVQGSYGYKDHQGIERVVEYVADEHGYRAEIKTNEPGTESQNPADVILHAEPIVIEEPKAAPAYSAPEPHYHAPHYPQYQAPQYQAPQYQAPQYHAPHYEAPQYEAPHYPRY